MALFKTYTKTANLDKLTSEVRASAITIALDSISALGSEITITFKAEIDPSNETILDSVVAAHVYSDYEFAPSKVILEEKKTSTGIQKVSVYEPEGGAATIVTHNYADKCSWYNGSVEVIGQAMNTSDNLTYTPANAKTHWIDLMSGRVYDEDTVMLTTANKYKPKIKVDGVEVTTGFAINYEAGTVTFESAQTGVITADFHYADKSWFAVRPKAGKVLSIRSAEVQFCKGITLPGPFIFAPWFINHPVYGTMEIPGQQVKYKNFKDFISACNEGQGLIPAIGDVQKDVHVFPFNYVRPKPIKFDDYIEIRVYCANHVPVAFEAGGQYATATFYVVIDDQNAV